MIPELKPFFRAWEKLRIPYNLILAAVLLLSHLPLMGAAFFRPMPLLIWLLGAVGANVLFLAGPQAEAYLDWLGIRSKVVRPALFIAGVLISIPLVWWYMPFAPLERWRLLGGP
jgi:hypothetical protein